MSTVSTTATKAAEAETTIGFLRIPEVTAEAQQSFDEDIAELGYVMNVSRLWSYQPATATGLFDLVRQAIAVDRLSVRQRAILVAACASAFGDSYCALVWGSRLAQRSDADTAAGVLRGTVAMSTQTGPAVSEVVGPT